MELDPMIWGPHYWFFLHTIAMSYPLTPNDVTKKKYYDFIHNLPLFLPVLKIGNMFSELLDKYPVTPYLDSRKGMILWVHFIHNKINIILDKPVVTYAESMDKYYGNYKPKNIQLAEQVKQNHQKVFGVSISVLIILTVYLHAK